MAKVLSITKYQNLNELDEAIKETRKQLDELDTSTVLTASEKVVKRKLFAKKLAELEVDFKKVKLNEELTDEVIKESENSIKEMILNEIKEHDLHYVATENAWAVAFREQVEIKHEFGSVVMDTFNWDFMNDKGFYMMFDKLGIEEVNTRFMKEMRKDNRIKSRITYAANTPPSSLNLFYFNPVELVDEPHHWMFDILINSVCGGKTENIEHIEKCLIHKRREPTDHMIPVIVFNDGGGTGKSLLACTILSNLLGQWCCGANLSIDNITGQFQDPIIGKAIGFINEKPEDNYDHRKLLAFFGSPNFTYNPKGVKAFEGDNIMWGFLAANTKTGSVRLAKNDSDRRFSIITGGEPLEWWVAQYMNVSVEEAKAWIVSVGQWILRKPEELGKYINSLIKKHGENVRVSRALQGEDYKKCVALQKSLEEQCWERIFLDTDFKYIRRTVVKEYYEACVTNKTYAKGRNTFYLELEEWLKKNKLDIQPSDPNNKPSWKDKDKRSRVDLYTTSVEGLNSTFICNDNEYFTIEHGRKVWKIELI